MRNAILFGVKMDSFFGCVLRNKHGDSELVIIYVRYKIFCSRCHLPFNGKLNKYTKKQHKKILFVLRKMVSVYLYIVGKKN